MTHSYQSCFFFWFFLCSLTPHHSEVGASRTSVWAFASGGGPKNVSEGAELETKEAATCEGPGQPSQLPKDKVMMLKEAANIPISCI